MGPSLVAAAAALLLAGGAVALSASVAAPPLAHEAASVVPASTPSPQMAGTRGVGPGALDPPADLDRPADPAADGVPAPAGEVPGGLPVAYRWPTGSPVPVMRGFDPPAQRWSRGHRGVDLRAAAGSPVLAAADGVVAFAGSVAGRPVVSVDHADGIRTTYEPVTPAVSAGERVRAGAVLGVLEPTGSHCAPGSCLHWGARRGPVAYVDPLGLLRAEIVIRLYPVR